VRIETVNPSKLAIHEVPLCFEGVGEGVGDCVAPVVVPPAPVVVPAAVVVVPAPPDVVPAAPDVVPAPPDVVPTAPVVPAAPDVVPAAAPVVPLPGVGVGGQARDDKLAKGVLVQLVEQTVSVELGPPLLTLHH